MNLRFTLLSFAAGFLALFNGYCSADPLPAHAGEWKTLLKEKVLPYWHDTAQDLDHGGYLLADDATRGRGRATEKQLVTQSRMIWGFSHAHLHGLGDGKRDYLKAAEQGRQFLRTHFYDKTHGGYYWKTDVAGKVLNDRKIIYGEAFVIYALVELHRASGKREPLDEALELYRVLQKRAHDPKHGGWIEHFQADWTPILTPQPGAEVEVPGYKSANAHLHLMEALAELCEVSKDPGVRESTIESVRLNKTYFYPLEAGKSCFHRKLDWSEVTDPKSAGLSYGHNVEFAWLMVRAQEVLGEQPSWEHFYRHIDHGLKYGFDHELGGMYNRGSGDEPATDQNKVWWVQSEILAALADALKHRKEGRYEEALDKLIHFINKHQADPKDGIWLDTVSKEGRPISPGKAHNWKANYHDVRGMVKFIELWK